MDDSPTKPERKPSTPMIVFFCVVSLIGIVIAVACFPSLDMDASPDSLGSGFGIIWSVMGVGLLAMAGPFAFVGFFELIEYHWRHRK